ncbi:Sodium:solute symporter family [Nesidiocoris tenuis]|uniref:Sodium:solute symporter family n=1 Tax=Nesidiocoris tenuis TaxID=355587 RepID=A0ABN7B7Y3_9HEMI|nr:Sodium:solute symporter family [Nesidiocoris tenuis]
MEMSACWESGGGGSFHWVDYTLLAAVLLGSVLIGMFYAWTGPKSKTSEDFLLGGGSMGTVPTALSLAAGFITAIELLGNPAEMYSHGTQFALIGVSLLLVAPITSYMYLPVFMKLQLTSAYEYLEMRFNKFTRSLAALIYVLQMTLYTSVAVYAPALALSHVTGLNTYIAVTVVYLICILYSSQGGLKAVIMTDTFQALVLVLSIILVMAIGSVAEGGISTVFQASASTDRIEFFNMDPRPTVRHSFWSVLIGGTFYWATMYCSNQASIQKYMAVETITQARWAIWTGSIGVLLTFLINFYTGAVLYKHYEHCDPLLKHEIHAMDEILPLYVMDNQSHLRGIPGLFVSGIFAASLGTVAAAISSLAAVCIKDVFSSLFNMNIPDHKGATISKWLSLFFGLLSFALVFVVEQLGGVLQVALSFNGITGGVTLGLFTLGMFFPWANAKGAMAGGISGLLVVGWIGFGAQVYVFGGGELYHDEKVISTDGCECLNSTATVEQLMGSPHEEALWLYRISYLWYSVIGCLVTVIVGLLVSWATGFEKPSNVDSSYISPPITALLGSLPNDWKIKLDIIVENKDPAPITTISRGSTGGHINLALNLESENLPPPHA